MSGDFQLVPFHGDELTATEIDGELHVAVKPICEAIGLDWSSQVKRMKRDPILSTCMVVTTMQVPGDLQKREVITIPLGHLNGFLFGISVSRLKESARPALLRYQRECYRVLHDYWIGGAAINPRKASPALPSTTELIRLADRIQAEREPGLRAMFYAQLAHVCDRLALPLPSLDAIGQEELAPSELASQFFEGIDALEQLGLTVDHSRNPDILALRLPQIAKLFGEHDVGIAVTAKVRNALKLSRKPQFIDARAVNSAIAVKVVYCWCFERTTS